MKFSIGDKILLKRTGEEGTVTAYISPQMLEVEVHGITFPVYEDEIDHPYLKWFTEKKQAQKKTKPSDDPLPAESKKQQQQRLPQGVYLSFLPVYRMEEMEDVIDQFKVYLLNETTSLVKFDYDLRTASDMSLFSHQGSLHAFGHLYLHSISFENMSAQPRFNWSFTAADSLDALQTIEGVLRMRPAKLFEQINEMRQKNEPTFNNLLFTDFSRAAVHAASPTPAPMPVVPKEKKIIRSFHELELPRYEVDLHVEQLSQDVKGLNNTEILQLQLDTLQHYVYLAIAHRQDKLMIIHGLGKGILRDAVHRVLRNTPHVDHFTNEWHGRYGFGATEVNFKY